jgi:hyperosmotically inducible protein
MKRLTGLVAAAGLAFTIACGQTDAGITTSVKSRLAADEAVKAYQVDVDTANKVVTLRGDVETIAQKEQAVRLARETEGVRDVIDQLRVNPTAATTGIGDPDVDADVDVDVDDDLEGRTREGADDTGDAARRGVDSVERGAKKGAEAVVDGAKKVGSEIRDAVTDDDPDSDRDGK